MVATIGDGAVAGFAVRIAKRVTKGFVCKVNAETKVRRRRKRAAGMLLAFVLLCAGWVVFAEHGLSVRREIETVDAIVVLSGAADYAARARLAAQLYHQRRATKVLLTDDDLRGGWSFKHERNLYFVERAQIELQREGVPPEHIEILNRKVYSTYDEAVAVRDAAQQRGWRAILIVTSAPHTRRAAWIFKRVLGDKIAFGIEGARREHGNGRAWWMSRDGWRSVAGEYVKIIYYAVRY